MTTIKTFKQVEAKVVTQDTITLLKILALGNRQIEEGKVISATDAINRLREGNGAL